jgi:hypothetical protein
VVAADLDAIRAWLAKEDGKIVTLAVSFNPLTDKADGSPPVSRPTSTHSRKDRHQRPDHGRTVLQRLLLRRCCGRRETTTEDSPCSDPRGRAQRRGVVDGRVSSGTLSYDPEAFHAILSR